MLRLSRLRGGEATIESGRSDWETVFDSRPCAPLEESQPSWPFRGMEGGGRIAEFSPGKVLLTVGDHGFNGVDFDVDWVSDLSTSYGKTLLIDLSDGTAEVYSIGHRNAQGLWVDDTASVYQTEHGPRGGDELNRLERGGVYGWPSITHGTNYSAHEWPREPDERIISLAKESKYAWVPSIGVSNLVRVSGARFERWSGDLLVGALLDEAVWRIREQDGGIGFAERIPIGERVRDIVEAPDGRILLLVDSYSLASLEPTELAISACLGCHSIDARAVNTLGPNLDGVLGRDVASERDYGFSAALAAFGGQWSRERLDEFLTDPGSVVPGTTMVMEGIQDPAVRREILDYLADGR